MSNQKIFSDPSKRAEGELNDVMQEGPSNDEHVVIVDEKLAERQKEKINSVIERPLPDDESVIQQDDLTITAHEALEEAPVLEIHSERQGVRLLFFTKDTALLEEGSISFRHVADLRNVFLEIHIVILDLTQDGEKVPIQRPFNNVWVYSTKSTSWWRLSRDAYHLAEGELEFGGGFRADVVVADDLFESGLAGWFIAKKYKRPFQLHIYEDFFDEAYLETLEHQSLYSWSMHYLLKRVMSVRTKTEFQKQAVIEKRPDLKDTIDIIPSYYDLSAWRDFKPQINLLERYPQFKFIILHISSMRNNSHSSEVLTGVAQILRMYASIGLVIVGNGPLRSKLEHEAIALGLQNQVEFEPMPSEILSHLKTSHLLVHLSENGEEDDVILGAAAVKLPMVANANGLAGSLFVDGESAGLCATDDSTCVSDSVNRYLNENQERVRFALLAQEIVFERVGQDYATYLEAYRQSVERSIAEASLKSV